MKMIKYIDKGTARQHLTDRLMESALNNARIRADVDAVFLDIAKNRLPVWMDELQTYDVAEVRHGRWIENETSYADPPTKQTCNCSICGKASTRPLGDWCRWCGAKMDEVEDE